MKKKIIKLLFSGSAVALGTLTMSSCASSAQNLFGIYAEVYSNYQDNTMINVGENESEKTSAGYSDIFNGFKFNNFGFSSSSSIIPTQESESNSDLSIYSSYSWQTVLYPLLDYTINLSNLFNMDFRDGNIDGLKEYEIISSSDNDLLEQFIYSWANVLSKGKESIRFGVTKIGIKVTNSNQSFFPQVSTDSTSGSNNNKLVWDENISEGGMYTYKSNNTFKIGFKFGYWNAANNNPNQGTLSIDKVKEMILKTGSWSSSEKTFNIDPIKDSMWLTLNFDFSLTLAYSENDLKTNTEDSNKNDVDTNNNDSNEHPDVTWTEILRDKQIVPIFFFNDSKNELNINKTSESSKEISELINSDKYDSAKINDTKNKYKNQITLLENWDINNSN